MKDPIFSPIKMNKLKKAKKYLMLQETMNKYDSPFFKLEQIVIMNYLKGLGTRDKSQEQTGLPLQQIKSAYNRGKENLESFL